MDPSIIPGLEAYDLSSELDQLGIEMQKQKWEQLLEDLKKFHEGEFDLPYGFKGRYKHEPNMPEIQVPEKWYSPSEWQKELKDMKFQGWQFEFEILR